MMKRVVVAFLCLVAIAGCQAPSQFEGTTQIVHLGRIQAEGQYDRGQKHGVWTYYNALGTVKGQGTYAHGKMVEGLEVTFHGNGQKPPKAPGPPGKKMDSGSNITATDKKSLRACICSAKKPACGGNTILLVSTSRKKYGKMTNWWVGGA